VSLEELNEDLTMTTTGTDSYDVNWWSLDLDPQFPPFNSDLAFDTTAFGLQNEQSTSISTNLHISPTFHAQNISFDTPQAPTYSFEQFSGPSPNFNSQNISFDTTPQAPTFGFEQFSGPSSTLTDFSSVPNNNLSFSVPSVVVAPAVVKASQPSQFIDATSFMQFQPTPYPAPTFPHTGALLPTIAPALVNASPSNASSPTVVPGDVPQHIPATSNASSPTVVPGDVPQHIPATSNASPQPTTTSVSLSQPAATPIDASSPPSAQITISSQHGSAAMSPLSDSLHSQLASNPETSALSSVSVTSVSDTSSNPLDQGDGRRSGRNPVPSKRHEQMNEIDGKNKKTTASPHTEKENIPSATPEWVIASQDHLLKSDLGKDWTACVQAWFELEQKLGYGSQAGSKVCLLIFFSPTWI
jgi:hypothetical protein